MGEKATRRHFLAALGGAAAALSGCTTSEPSRSTTRPADWTPTPTPTPEPWTFGAFIAGYLVEPEEDDWGENDDDVDASLEHLPDLQAAVGPAATVRVVEDYGDDDDYGFYGDVDERAARDAVESIGFAVDDTATDFSHEERAVLGGRLETLRGLDVDLPPAWVPSEDSRADLAYRHDVPQAAVTRTNQQLSRTGLVVLSLGPPSGGRLWSVAPASASLDGTSVTVDLSGDGVSWLLSTYGVPSDPERYPLRVYFDGEHVGTRRLTDDDVAAGPALSDPATELRFADEFTAAGAYAALRHPAASTVTFTEP